MMDAAAPETKRFHVRDGLGYALWHRAGKHSAILSGRRAGAVDRRAAELAIAHVLQGHDAKAEPFRELVERIGLEPRQVCYVGDDLPDLPVLRAVGLAACPADAVAEVRDAAHLVTRTPGGRGAVREVIEVILKSQGKWASLVSD
jgi:3-deoxy-D-manno-octulosonate 8-phosphate phosphatase (KDO 8-P phosphatase)